VKILLLDIETSPNLAYVWGTWQQDVNVNHMVNTSTTLCWAAKWHDQKRVMFDSVHQSSEKQMLRGIHRLLDEADVVVHYNGKKFDVPTLNKEFLLNGMAPPSPYKQVDLLQVMRGTFRFQSNKLDFVAKQLGFGGKTGHEGFQLWVKCMAGDNAAWRRMREYNMNDVVQLEKVYNRVLPWIGGHPNHNTYGKSGACPKCGKKRLQRRGEARNAAGSYQRFQCLDCGGWSRGSEPQKSNVKRMVSV
jgi:DNA polymerase elongation subunit (family B)/predicted RNA-binding Zn-ribbon protein involved in translation (DUF1610 family)